MSWRPYPAGGALQGDQPTLPRARLPGAPPDGVWAMRRPALGPVGEQHPRGPHRAAATIGFNGAANCSSPSIITKDVADALDVALA